MHAHTTILLRKTTALLISAVLLAALLTHPAAAHAPSPVTPVYDQQTSTLAVTIGHPVNANPRHYIKEVTISVNGQVVSRSEYTSQPADTFTIPYPLALRPGDSVEVTAICSISGRGSGTFIMPGPTAAAGPAGTDPSAVPTQKSPGALSVLAAAVGIALVVRKRPTSRRPVP